MNTLVILIAAMSIGLFSNYTSAEEEHSHKKETESHKEDHEHEKSHGDEEDHEHDHKREQENGKHGGHDEGDFEGSHGHEHGEESFGKGKAITAVYNEGEKFKLSSESEKLLGIKATPLKQSDNGKFKISNDSLVRYQNHLGVFIKEDGWFVLINLDNVKQTETYVLIESSRLKDGMQVVSSGVPLLRVAHLQASGQGGKGHAH